MPGCPGHQRGGICDKLLGTGRILNLTLSRFYGTGGFTVPPAITELPGLRGEAGIIYLSGSVFIGRDFKQNRVVAKRGRCSFRDLEVCHH